MLLCSCLAYNHKTLILYQARVWVYDFSQPSALLFKKQLTPTQSQHIYYMQEEHDFRFNLASASEVKLATHVFSV